METAKFAETMIGSKDLPKTVEFYTKFLGMEVADKGNESFVILSDPKTNQRLCIVGDPTLVNARPSIETQDIETTVKNIVALGGTIVSQDTYPTMKVANVKDTEDREMCVWQTLD